MRGRQWCCPMPMDSPLEWKELLPFPQHPTFSKLAGVVAQQAKLHLKMAPAACVGNA